MAADHKCIWKKYALVFGIWYYRCPVCMAELRPLSEAYNEVIVREILGTNNENETN